MLAELLTGGLGLLGGLFGKKRKEDPYIKKQREIAMNQATWAALPRPSVSTDMFNTAVKGSETNRDNSIQSVQELLRKQGNLDAGTSSRAIADINKGAKDQMSDLFSQYKTQEALAAPQRSMQAASIIGNLPGKVMEPDDGTNSAIANAAGGLAGIVGQHSLDKQTDALLKTLTNNQSTPGQKNSTDVISMIEEAKRKKKLNNYGDGGETWQI